MPQSKSRAGFEDVGFGRISGILILSWDIQTFIKIYSLQNVIWACRLISKNLLCHL